MMIGEDKRIIVDANILIYCFFDKDTYYLTSRQKLNLLLQNNSQFYISRQIVREFLVYVTRFNNENTKIPISDFMKTVYRFINQFTIVDENSIVTQNLYKLIEKHNLSGKKIHDANIVATMQSYNILKLLTNNVKDFERFNDIIEIIPLIE